MMKWISKAFLQNLILSQWKQTGMCSILNTASTQYTVTRKDRDATLGGGGLGAADEGVQQYTFLVT